VQVVIERQPARLHGAVQGLFARMTERRMPDVVHQRQRLNQVDVKLERLRYSPRNLCDFERMRQPVAEVIGVAARENLRFRFEPPKGSRVDNAIPVALKVVSVRMLRLRIPSPAGFFHVHGVCCEHGKSLVSRFQGFKVCRAQVTNFQGFKVSKKQCLETLKPRSAKLKM
jgi:hypothetical protein